MDVSRRRLLQLLLAAGVLPTLGTVKAAPAPLLTRPIPSSGERLPVIGMGSYITFDVGTDDALLAQRTEVLRAFFDAGGRLIDSSPMYDTSEAAIGA